MTTDLWDVINFLGINELFHIPNRQGRTSDRPSIVQHSIAEPQLCLKWSPSRTASVELSKDHKGIETSQAKVEILSPFRPVLYLLAVLRFI